MRLLHVCALGIAAAAVVGCTHDTSGSLVTPDPVAGLRFINAVPDTSALDFRIVDVVNNGLMTFNATYRTGGNPYGVSTAFLPPHLAVLAGTREIRVFPTSTNPAVASQVVFDTTFTFVAGENYTAYLYGYARTANTPHLNMMITHDSVPAPGNGKLAVRVLNLIPTTAGGPSPAAPVDLWLTPQAATPPFAASASQVLVGSNIGFGGIGTYNVAADTSSTLKLTAFAAGDVTTALFTVNLPTGTLGTATADPIPGSNIAKTGFTAVLVPQSFAGSLAPQTAAFTNPTILYMIDLKPPRTAP